MTNTPRIAIPVPTTTDLDYNERAWPLYADAVKQAGGEPVKVPLTLTPVEIARLVTTCQGILLPGSPADVNPHKYAAELEPETAPADSARESVDELLLQDAHNLYKPILGICYGIQSLNVWRSGTLVQHLLPMPVNHEAGKSVAIAHNALIEPDSLLATIVGTEPDAEHSSSAKSTAGSRVGSSTESSSTTRAGTSAGSTAESTFVRLPINSSHHQAVGIVGDGLRVCARCPQDAVVEAVEGTHPDHFVLGVQWHPERSYAISAASRALFTRFLSEARAWKPRVVLESVG